MLQLSSCRLIHKPDMGLIWLNVVEKCKQIKSTFDTDYTLATNYHFVCELFVVLLTKRAI